MFEQYKPPRLTNGASATDPPEPSGNPPPAGAPPNPYVMPVANQQPSPAQWNQRRGRLQSWAAANPTRAARQQMGRNADGSINYDRAVYSDNADGTRYTGPAYGANNPRPVTPTPPPTNRPLGT